MSYAQAVSPTVQVPFDGSALMNIGPNGDANMTMGGEYKQPKNVIEQEKPVFWTGTSMLDTNRNITFAEPI